MNFLSLLFCVSYVTFIGSEYVGEEQNSSFQKNVGITEDEDKQRVQTFVQYYFYTKDNQASPILIKNNNVKLLTSHFDPNKKTVFVFHGWTGDSNAKINLYVRKSIFKNYDVNLFIVEWFTEFFYPQATNDVPETGKTIGNFINKIHETYNIDGSSFTLIGFSLGGQLCGTVGKSVNKKIGHIIALDPAGPWFTTVHKEASEHLDFSDAALVEVIHTNGNAFGKSTPIGHFDYFPNGGVIQPGCHKSNTCSHSRACLYFGKALDRGFSIYKAQLCANWELFVNGDCANNEVREMGSLSPANGTYGSYFLYINDEEF